MSAKARNESKKLHKHPAHDVNLNGVWVNGEKLPWDVVHPAWNIPRGHSDEKIAA